jgi:tol-pal system protein YbgF
MTVTGRLNVALLVIGGFVAIISAGCAPQDTQQVQADQFALRGMVANNQQRIDSLQEKIQRLDDRISELEHNGPATPGSSKQLDSIQQRLNKLESQANFAQPGAANASSATPPSPAAPGEAPAPGAEGTPTADGSPTAAGTPTAAGSPGAGSAAVPGDTSNSASAASAGTPSWQAMMDQELSASHDDQGGKLYQTGLVHLKAGRYPQALSQFEALQRHYPKSNLSEPAEFFAANALYEMGKYDQAILQFNDQTMRFPKGRFASAALLREAQAFMKINDRIDARLTLQKLLSDLPDSPEAPMAKSMMQTLAS